MGVGESWTNEQLATRDDPFSNFSLIDVPNSNQCVTCLFEPGFNSVVQRLVLEPFVFRVAQMVCSFCVQGRFLQSQDSIRTTLSETIQRQTIVGSPLSLVKTRLLAITTLRTVRF
jgi:hypothetical protein